MIECAYCHAGRHSECTVRIRSIGVCKCYARTPENHDAAIAMRAES